jgi:hypothetical protein
MRNDAVVELSKLVRWAGEETAVREKHGKSEK